MAKTTKVTTPAPASKKAAKTVAITKWDEKLAAMASKAAAVVDSIGTGGNFISFKGGKITYKGGEVPGASMNVVVLAAVLENAYYVGKYNANAPQPPVCFAFGEDQATMCPHEKSGDPQSEACKGCEHNEWGSADTGRGKACKNIVRLALIAESDLDDIPNAEVAYARVPVTSTKAWAGYVKQLEGTLHVPPFAVVTELSLVDSEDDQFNVVFKLSEKIDESQLEELFAKVEVEEEAIKFPYQPAEPEAQKPTSAKKKSGTKPKFAR